MTFGDRVFSSSHLGENGLQLTLNLDEYKWLISLSGQFFGFVDLWWHFSGTSSAHKSIIHTENNENVRQNTLNWEHHTSYKKCLTFYMLQFWYIREHDWCQEDIAHLSVEPSHFLPFSAPIYCFVDPKNLKTQEKTNNNHWKN